MLNSYSTMSPTIPNKLPQRGVTIFSVMTALANEVEAVNVSQGFPDYPADPLLPELLYGASKSGHNQYAPMPGLLALRQAVADKYQRVHGCVVDPEHEITITPGATAALFTAIASVVSAGDEVIIMDPSYDSYAPSIIANGGIVRTSNLRTNTYTPDWDHVRSLITRKTRLIIINSPHNPCSSVLELDDLDTLAEICNKHDLLVLSDEVYELITFDEHKHISASTHPGLCNRTFVVTSFGKTFHITGWKIGVCVAPSDLTRVFRQVHQYLSFCVNTPAQVALAEYMKDTSRYLGLQSFFTKKRDLLRSLLVGSAWSLRACSGSYFQLLGYEGISDEQDVDFAKRITREFGVATIPLSPFYNGEQRGHERLVRVCFAKEDSTIRLAAERLVCVR